MTLVFILATFDALIVSSDEELSFGRQVNIFYVNIFNTVLKQLASFARSVSTRNGIEGSGVSLYFRTYSAPIF